MNITVKKLAELHKPAHNIRRHSDKQITEYIRPRSTANSSMVPEYL